MNKRKPRSKKREYTHWLEHGWILILMNPKSNLQFQLVQKAQLLKPEIRMMAKLLKYQGLN